MNKFKICADRNGWIFYKWHNTHWYPCSYVTTRENFILACQFFDLDKADIKFEF